jgi:MarR family transcriptional regulator, organic hydroperoxide resistance regulator
MTINESTESIDFLFAQVCHLHYTRAHQLLETIGLYRGQPPVLRSLWRQEGQTQSDLATQLNIAPATLTRMLQRMEKNGFIVRKPDEKDLRLTRVFLTENGRQIQEKVKEIWDTMEDETFQDFCSEDLAALRKGLNQMRVNLIQSTNTKELRK